MPTFSAIALDRFLEPGASKPPPAPAPKNDGVPASFSGDEVNSSTKKFDIPPSYPPIRRRNTMSSVPEKKNNLSRPLISPALYATPESTPLPDSPSSISPSSPYIINHKRRGPRLMKSFSDKNVVAVSSLENKKEDGDGEAKLDVIGRSRSLPGDEMHCERKEGGFDGEMINGHEIMGQECDVDGLNGDKVGKNGEMKVAIGSNSENEDFYDPQESMSVTSTVDGDCYDGERSNKANTPMGEFFDAWEELSSDSGRQTQHSLADVETELREMRLSLLMEIEKRKQAEETLSSMHSQWHKLRENLGTVGLILPADISALSEDGQPDVNPTEDICRQIYLARFVSESVGRGVAKAEAEAEMEAQLELKNFEIARLCDRLHYYEAMNREMSQRNQETIEIARRERQKRRRRQKWVWGSIATAITLGSAALAWSYLPNGEGSSSFTDSLETPETERDVQ